MYKSRSATVNTDCKLGLPVIGIMTVARFSRWCLEIKFLQQKYVTCDSCRPISYATELSQWTKKSKLFYVITIVFLYIFLVFCKLVNLVDIFPDVIFGRFLLVRSGRPKRIGSGQFNWKDPRRTRTFFPPQLFKFPRFGRQE